MELQAKKKSYWSTFKNAYLRSKNLKKFWNGLDKTNLSEELKDTVNLFLNSESYDLSSKFWRHVNMNQLKIISNDKKGNYESLISQEYFTFTYFNDALIKDAWDKIKNNKIILNVNLFKKQNNFSLTQSINHNLILVLLYENIKLKEVFSHFKKLEKFNLNNPALPSLLINDTEITQDNINSLFEFEKIEMLLNKIKNKNNIILEIGAGAGRTAKTILSIKDKVKYVIADIPPAINLSFNNIKKYFPNKKIETAFKVDDRNELNNLLKKNDVLFIFPHQIKLFDEKTFDMSIAIDCLHEMEKKTIKNYMAIFEDVSKSLYFKVWEYCGLPYSFYQHYSVHDKKDYAIKNHWTEHLKERCIYPSNFFHLGYEF